MGMFFFLFNLCVCLISINSLKIVSVEYVIDSPVNISSCSIESSGKCNLRSAVSLCLLHLIDPMNECQILFPQATEIQINASFGEIQLFQPTGSLSLIGNDCQIRQVAQMKTARLFNISTTLPFNFFVSNLLITKFGNSKTMGGAIYMKGISTSVLSNLVFDKNSGSYGGAVALSSSKFVTLRNCRFVLNNAKYSAGGIYFGNSNSAVLLSDTNFIKNRASTGSGGGIYVTKSVFNISIIDSTFFNNTAAVSGGGLHINSYNRQIRLRNCSILFNSCFPSNRSNQKGGGIFILDYNQEIEISQSVIASNTAYSGGGLYVGTGNAMIRVLNSTITQNRATYDGGGIFLYNQNSKILILDFCFFTLNVCGHYGSSIYSSIANDLHISSTIFRSNSGGSSGTLSLDYNHHDLTFSDLEFDSNICTKYGSGALDMIQYQYNINFTRCSFTSNVGVTSGAFLFSQFSTGLLFQDCFFSGNSGNTGGHGGMGTQISNTQFHGCTFENGNAFIGGAVAINTDCSEISFVDCVFRNHQAYRGGVLYIYEYSDSIHFENTTLSSNTATGDGGAIYLNRVGSMSISHSKFMENIASGNGGGVFLGHLNEIQVYSTLFLANRAISGGGIYVLSENSNVEVTSCLFLHNSAVEAGGGVSIKDSNTGVKFESSTFQFNTCGGSGGGISLQSDNLHCIILTSSFTSNTASISGGAVHSAILNSDFVIFLSSFENNSSPYGGGVYIGDYHQYVEISESYFYSNRAEYGSGVFANRFNSELWFNSVIWEKNTATRGGAGLMSFVSSIVINDCIFTMNFATSASGAYIRGTSITILKVQVSHNFASAGSGGLFLEEADELLVDHSTFINNTGNDGGALFISSTQSTIVNHSTFLFNQGQSSGGALFGTQISHLHINNCNFTSNSANSGGAVVLNTLNFATINQLFCLSNQGVVIGGCMVLADCVNISLSESYFISNSLLMGLGSALYLTATNISLERNYFTLNSATNGAGTIYWKFRSSMHEPKGLMNNSFFNNSASYGSKYATEAVTLVMSPANQYNITDYTVSAPPIVIFLQDHYSQIITTESSSIIELVTSQASNCAGHSGYISGGVIGDVKTGFSNFTSIAAHCAPGYSLSIEASHSDPVVATTKFHLNFRPCTIGEYYSGIDCIPCERGTYSLQDPNSLSDMSQISVCQSCPTTAQWCSGKEIELKPSYWRITSNSAAIFSCPTGKFGCVGGAGVDESLCGSEYYGPLCALCRDGYGLKLSTQTCVSCDETGGWDEVSIIFVVILGFVISATLIFLLNSNLKEKIKSFDDLVLFAVLKFNLSRGKSQKDILQNTKLISKRMFIRMKVYITLYQILSVLPFVLDTTFPHSLSQFVSIWKFLSGSISDSLLLDCSMSSYDFIDTLYIDTIYPIVVSIVLYFVSLIHVRMAPSEGNSIRSTYLMIFLFWTYLILPSVSTKIFQTFSCKDLDPDETLSTENIYLTADYSVSCTSQKYFYAFLWAIGMLVVYPLGCSFFYFRLLYNSRHEIISRDDSNKSTEERARCEMNLKPLQLLYAAYRPHLWWWEMVETANRLLLTGVLVVIAQGSAIQILVGLLLSLLFIQLYVYFEPFDDQVISQIKSISQWQIFFVFFIALLNKGNYSAFSTRYLRIALIVVIFANIIVDSFKFLRVVIFKDQSRHLSRDSRTTSEGLSMKSYSTSDYEISTDVVAPFQSSARRETSNEF